MTDAYRLGIDVGGTFTDACAFSPNGKVFRAKVPSTPHDQSIGVKNAIDRIRAMMAFTGKFGALHHGSTVATNALLEGKGVPAALIVTQGHKDVLVARRSQIPGGLAAWINWTPPAPLIPLERTLQVSERISVDGSEIRPVDKEVSEMSAPKCPPQGPLVTQAHIVAEDQPHADFLLLSLGTPKRTAHCQGKGTGGHHQLAQLLGLRHSRD